MADVRPFKGIRPRSDLVHEVASPPYDVLSSEEARQQSEHNPYSFLHVVKAEIDLPPDVDVHAKTVYQMSADNFLTMRTSGVLIEEEQPCFYIYRLTMGEHVQTGLVAGASVDEYEQGLIKKHELTRRAKEDDRARHVEVLKANAGPVLFTYRHDALIQDKVRSLTARQDPMYDFRADDGIVHQLWVVSEPEAIQEIQTLFRSVPALYVADGHHRTASALRVRDLMRDKNPTHTGKEACNHFLAVLFPDNELNIMGYHRLVKDLNGLTPQTLCSRIEGAFDLEVSVEHAPDRLHQFSMYLEGVWYRLTAKPGTYPEDDPVKSLDASIRQEDLLGPILGITDPRVDDRIDFVGGIRGTGELIRRCSHDMTVAFAMAPVTVEQLMAIADADAIMPPKSTWFEPKLRSGVVVRSLEE